MIGIARKRPNVAGWVSSVSSPVSASGAVASLKEVFVHGFRRSFEPWQCSGSTERLKWNRRLLDVRRRLDAEGQRRLFSVVNNCTYSTTFLSGLKATSVYLMVEPSRALLTNTKGRARRRFSRRSKLPLVWLRLATTNVGDAGSSWTWTS